MSQKRDRLLRLLAARKLLDAELKDAADLPVGAHDIPAGAVQIALAGGTVTREHDGTISGSTFPLAVAFGYLVSRMKPVEKAAFVERIDQLADGIEGKDADALHRKAGYELVTDEFKTAPRYAKEGTRKGATKVMVVGDLQIDA